MRQRTITVFSLIVLGLLTGCSFVTGSGNVITEERSVSDFDGVQLSIDADVTILQGEQTFLTIRGEDNILDRIETNVSAGRLTIETRRSGLMTTLNNTEPIEITISTPNVEEISISSSGNVYADEVKSEHMELSISGSGNLEIDRLTAGSLDVQIRGSGDASFSGQADRAEIEVSGSGTISAENLALDIADVQVTGSGAITTWVVEKLDATVTSSGHVRYYGSPQVEQRITGSGNVTSIGDKE